MTPLHEATKTWVDTIREYYRDFKPSELNQVFARGYFGGMSEREVLKMANHLHKSNEDFPLYNEKGDGD